MKFKLLLLFIFCSFASYSQCFDCAHSLGGFVEDYTVDIDKVFDGIILTFNPGQGWGRSIYKYDFNCNLLWSNDFIPDDFGVADYMIFYDTTVDNNGNVYSIFYNDRGGVTIDGFPIDSGFSLVELNSNGEIEWVQRIDEGSSGYRKVLFWKENIYVVGQIREGINNNLGLTITNGMGSQYFIAKFDLQGNLLKAEHFGGNYNENLFDAQIDEDGNIYISGTSNFSTSSSPFLTKIDSDLNLIWDQEMSGYLNSPFTPWTLYYNNSNQKLYVWGKYDTGYGTNNGCNVGSAVMEISKNTGALQNKILIEDCGFDQPVGNGIGDVEQRGFFTHVGNDLYVLSSFRGELTLGGQTISTTQTLDGEYNSDLVLYKIDLTNFSAEIVLRSEGDNSYPANYDLAGPIIAFNNSVYLTSSYTSNSITINGNNIQNNSGNNARDVLFYKHILSETGSDSLITYTNTCLSEPTEFTLNGNFDSVSWNFDDPDSSNNTSTSNNPSHIFTVAGNYNVSALVSCGAETETLDLEVVITAKPHVNQIKNLHSCEDSFGSQTSSSFNTASIENDLIGNQSNVFVEYYDANGNQLPDPLPNPFSNPVSGRESITARVAYDDNPSCFEEITFDLIVDPLPETFEVADIYACDDDGDGITNFDLSKVESTLLGGQSGMKVDLFHENGELLPHPLPKNIANKVPNQETLTARVTNLSTNCFNEISIELNVTPKPIINSPTALYGCDDNNDGISEYFDTSGIEDQISGSHENAEVSFFDSNGKEMRNIPSLYTNLQTNEDYITVRVSDKVSRCYSEKKILLKTTSKPNVNQPSDVYGCDAGSGFAYFDTRKLEEEMIGQQDNLQVSFFDSMGNELADFSSDNFKNHDPYDQEIVAKIENISNKSCYEEVHFHLKTMAPPEINLEDTYQICYTNDALTLNSDEKFTTTWFAPDGSILSNTSSVTIQEEGIYAVSVLKEENGILCESYKEIELVHSAAPAIDKISYQDFSERSTVEIFASSEGDFEYSLDGISFQNESFFANVEGGEYNVTVRDKYGCGEVSQKINIINYTRFFTPNNDGYHDTWTIKGIANLTTSFIQIYDRYGKLLKQLDPASKGWDGTYNGHQMPSDDYWFQITLNDGKIHSGHFSLLRSQ